MAEWNSAPVFPDRLQGTRAPSLRWRPTRTSASAPGAPSARLLEIVALSSHQGLLTASQGRSYEHSLRPGRTLELSAIARLFFGRGWIGQPLPRAAAAGALLSAITASDVDPRLAELAVWTSDEALEWCFRQGENGIAALYHHKTRDHAMGSIAAYRPGEWGYQETVLHLRLGDRPEAQIWINHPGERILSGYARPSYWGGCGTLPRVAPVSRPRRARFRAARRAGGFHPCLAAGGGDGRGALRGRPRPRARREGACAAHRQRSVRARSPTGPTAGCEIRLPGMRSRWIVRLSDLGREGEPRGLRARVSRVLPRATRRTARFGLTTPTMARVVCRPDGVDRRRRDGVLDPASWTHAGQATFACRGESRCRCRRRRVAADAPNRREQDRRIDREDQHDQNEAACSSRSPRRRRWRASAAAQTELRMMWYSDGNEGEVMQDLLTRFEAGESRHQGRARQRRLRRDPDDAAGAARSRQRPGHRARDQHQGAGAVTGSTCART